MAKKNKTKDKIIREADRYILSERKWPVLKDIDEFARCSRRDSIRYLPEWRDQRIAKLAELIDCGLIDADLQNLKQKALERDQLAAEVKGLKHMYDLAISQIDFREEKLLQGIASLRDESESLKTATQALKKCIPQSNASGTTAASKRIADLEYALNSKKTEIQDQLLPHIFRLEEEIRQIRKQTAADEEVGLVEPESDPKYLKDEVARLKKLTERLMADLKRERDFNADAYEGD
jgi:hypothetical protein